MWPCGLASDTRRALAVKIHVYLTKIHVYLTKIQVYLSMMHSKIRVYLGKIRVYLGKIHVYLALESASRVTGESAVTQAVTVLDRPSPTCP